MWSSTSIDVPLSFEEFERKYSYLVTYAIKYYSRWTLRQEDLEDLRQQVYLRIWEKQYLDRCRVLIAERRGKTAFTTLLFWLVRSVCVNQFAKNARNPLNRARHIFDPRERVGSRRVSRHRLPPGTVDIEPRRADVTFEGRLLDRDELQRLHRFVRTTTHGARVARTLQLFYEGYSMPEITAMTRSKRCRVIQDRWALRDALVTLTQAG